ncbi:HNH endonuclease signature motif containing protein [Microbacterium sp. zg-YB36]|uniref:HNH endonuclease signature motif containing protein n=1 Tax=Microbacterium sp. zg-YB36 TaxID=2969407 RepID=UPI00214B114A|nr:HNH endonuclease signature motif containing protein [Microbacterium sp. zg-YB36]MDL5351565.1 DUF222 domain-containing protein [Microbacterium sp. zg-YB36]
MNASPTTTPTDVMSASDVVAAMVETDRQLAAIQARQLVLLGRAGDIAAAQTAAIPLSSQRERELPLRSIAAELAAATRRSDRGMQNRIHQAGVMRDRFPATVTALAEGRIDIGHLRVIEEAGARLTDPDARALLEQAALAVAEKETAGRARPAILALAQRIDPVPFVERYATAAEARRVWVHDLADGMAELGALLPAHLVHGIMDRITQCARMLLAEDGGTATNDSAPDAAGEAQPVDTRTMDQRRADVLADLLLTGHATAEASDGTVCETDAIVAHIQVTVPAATLTGADVPATFVGHGPMDPGTARHFASHATAWDRLFYDLRTGAIDNTDTYRPSRAQRRFLRGRDEHCRFPGCRAAVWHCDIDHTVDYAHGGPTRVCNLAHLCKRHHMLKHNTAWTVEQHPGGILVWTSPTGRVYPDIPQRTLEFIAAASSGAPPPF